VRWLEAVVADAHGANSKLGAAVKLRLPTGARIEVSNASQVALAAASAQALERPSAPC